MQDILTPFLNEHSAKRNHDGEAHVDVDMVDALLRHEEMEGDESISEGNIRSIAWDTFMGGTETVSTITAAEILASGKQGGLPSPSPCAACASFLP